MRILLIERDRSTAASIELMLRAVAMNVHSAETGEDGLDLGRRYDFDLIILDPTHVDMPGSVLLRGLRATVDTPILMLADNDNVPFKVTFLDQGADDVLSKPFHCNELVARINAIVRRSRHYATSVLTIGDLAVDIAAHVVTLAGAPVHLTSKEFAILGLLALRQGTVITKETMLDHLYGGRDEPEPKIIDVFVCKIRQKLSAALPGQSVIETVWGRGYILRAPATIEGTAAPVCPSRDRGGRGSSYRSLGDRPEGRRAHG